MSTPRPRRRIASYAVDVELRDRRGQLSKQQIRKAAETILSAEGVLSAEIVIAIVNDETIHVVNQRHLNHDEPTDVISFLYGSQQNHTTGAGLRRDRRLGRGLAVEGELVISAETAAREAQRRAWPVPSELRLYLAHGLLHICGYDDLQPEARRTMRRREREVLAELGIEWIPR